MLQPALVNERFVQNLIWKDIADKYRGYYGIVAPNCKLFGWESDLIQITRKNLVIEYEIKISRGDFRADFKKIRHRILDSQKINEPQRGAAYFYYAVPRDLVRIDEVPQHAGLIYCHPVFQIIKPAPRLHSVKITDGQRQWLERSLIHRYWRERLSIDAAASGARGREHQKASVF